MLDQLRKPFLIVAIVLLLLVVLIETGSRLYIGTATGSSELPTPGLGIPYLALVDGILLFVLLLHGLAKFQLVPPSIFGMVQGLLTLVLMLLMLIASIILIYVAILLVTLMITLLLAVPFGTIAYFAAFADFDLVPARATLGLVMALKLGAVVCLFLSQRTFKGLLLLLLTSLLVNILVSFLHGLVPGFLVSILDGVAAIIIAVLAAIWALVKLIGSIPGVVMGLRADRHLT
jgi:hypothetical protein